MSIIFYINGVMRTKKIDLAREGVIYHIKVYNTRGDDEIK